MVLRTRFARLVNALLRPVGIALRSRDRREWRWTLRGALAQAHALGLAPRTVIDVGVARGTAGLADAFPEARLVLIEPVAECAPALAAIAARRPGTVTIQAAAGRQPGHVTIRVHPDPARSSQFTVPGAADADTETREVPVVTLDQVRREHALAGPVLVKIDVEGAEFEVLAGADEVLADTAYLVVEGSLFDFYRAGVLAGDIIAYLAARGFVLYDLVDPQYRPLDGALAQADLVFVPRDGPLRRVHAFHGPDI